ncbi:MAG: hypothetical protein GY810_20500 [Aureispira sp.]|nr:hypothetical protein [Aureispira sp.]
MNQYLYPIIDKFFAKIKTNQPTLEQSRQAWKLALLESVVDDDNVNSRYKELAKSNSNNFLTKNC